MTPRHRPRRRTTTGTGPATASTPLAELASTHTTDVATLLWKTLGAHSQPAFNTYVDSGLWKALVPARIIIRFPAGH